MSSSWGETAKAKNIRYFLISFVDLFGTMRAKIVPATLLNEAGIVGSAMSTSAGTVPDTSGATGTGN